MHSSFHRCCLCSNESTLEPNKTIKQYNDPAKWNALPSLINKKQIKSCEVDEPGSAMKCQYAKKLLLDPCWFSTEYTIPLLCVKQITSKLLIRHSKKKVFNISPYQNSALGKIYSWGKEIFPLCKKCCRKERNAFEVTHSLSYPHTRQLFYMVDNVV